MQDDLDKKRQEVKDIQEELNNNKLSRRGLLHRLKGVGLGFGAVVVLGAEGAGAAVDASAGLKSTNSVLNDIIQEGRQSQAGDDGKAITDPKGALQQDAFIYRRIYSRGYRRVYDRYSRFYPRFYRRF